MADNDSNSDDKTEEPSPEKREEAREKGQVATSRELTSVFILASVAVFMTYYLVYLYDDLKKLFTYYLSFPAYKNLSDEVIIAEASHAWQKLLKLIIPPFAVTTFTAITVTVLQTRFNWSWKKLNPDFKRLDPLQGLARMVSGQSAVELAKSIAKTVAVALMAWLILKSEWKVVPGLIQTPIISAWSHWFQITHTLMWSVAGLLIFVAAGDYLYSFLKVEKELKMSKQEVKEEYKRREVDPNIKARMRRMQREYANRKMVEATKSATVVITNPTHFAVALKYEMGMRAPVVVAKGIDSLALRMREAAKESKVQVVENKALARTLYKVCEVGQQIPESLFRAVSEVIRYVFQAKGIRIQKTRSARSS